MRRSRSAVRARSARRPCTTISSTGTATSAPVTLPTGTPVYRPHCSRCGAETEHSRSPIPGRGCPKADSSYNALQVDVNRRFSQGLTLRGIYTWSKVLDDGDSYNATAAGNAVALVSNPYNVRADWGLGTFDVRNVGVITATYELPFGHGKRWLGSANGVGGTLASGWSVNSIVTVQSGFPFTPQLSYNPSNNGDTRNPVRPFLNPNFTGTAMSGSQRVVQSGGYRCSAEQQRIFRKLGRDTLLARGWPLGISPS